MPGRAITGPFGISDALNVRAVAILGPNSRVKGAKGKVGTLLDVVMYPGVSYPASTTGIWIFGNTRVTASGVPTVGATSQGITFGLVSGVPTPTSTMSAITPDPRIKNT